MIHMNLPFMRHKIVAVVDVSPGGASVAILSCPTDSAATVLATGFSSLTLEERTPEQAKSRGAAQIQEAADIAKKLYAAAGQKAPITDAYVVVHAPWSRSVVVRAEERYETDTRITTAHIADFGKSALANVRDIDATRLLEGSVIQVALNGYPTSAPEGKSARTLRTLSLGSDLEEAIRSQVEGAVHTAFPVAKVSWRTGLRALLALAREALPVDSFLIVDMGVDDTHVISMHDGSLDQLVVPEGVRSILARVAGKRTPEEVLGLMRMLARDACSTEACDATTQALAAAEPDLVKIFGEAFAKVSSNGKVPNDVLLVTHTDFVGWFSAFLSRIDFSQFTITGLPLSVHSGASLDIGRWVGGAGSTDALTVASALVNIEARA